MVMECGQLLDPDLNCTAMFKPVVTDMGVCYTFNADPHDPLHADYKGSYAAWYFLLNVEESEYEYTEHTSGAVGFQMLVHRQEELAGVRDGGFSVAPGEKTSIAVTRSRVVMDKEMECYNTSDLNFRNPLRYYDFYTFRSCTVECFTVYAEHKCGCIVDVVKGKAKICKSIDEVTCFYKMYGYFFRDPMGAKRCRCPHECSTLEYEVKISHSRYPSRAAMEEFSRQYNMSEAQQRANLARVEMYYETLHVRTTKLSFDYGVYRLGGDLGGYMGLMLGASILSVMELVDFLGRCLYTAFSRTKQTTRVDEFNDK